MIHALSNPLRTSLVRQTCYENKDTNIIDLQDENFC